MLRMEGVNSLRGFSLVSGSTFGEGCGRRESFCQDWRIGMATVGSLLFLEDRDLEVDFEGRVSRRQNEKLRIPISMLKIRRGLASVDEPFVFAKLICGSSSWRR